MVMLASVQSLLAITEEDFFNSVKNKREVFKSGIIEFEYYYIKWNKKDYLKFVDNIEKCIDKTYTEVKKCFIVEISPKLEKRDFIPRQKFDSKIVYIYNSDSNNLDNLVPNKIYVKREYFYDTVEKYLKNKFNTEKKDVCKMKEYLFVKNKEYMERCVFLNSDKIPEKIAKQSANDENLRQVLTASEIGWLSNIDRSFGVEKIKTIAKKYSFEVKNNSVIIKTENGMLVFNADKSFSSRKVISYYKGTKEKNEEVLYGAYTPVNGIYIPFFVSSSHFSRDNNSVETDFYLIESFKLTELSEDNFKIN